MEDGDNLIELSDLDYYGGKYYFHLNRNVAGGLTVQDGLGGIIIVGNGHQLIDVYGTEDIGLDLGTTNYAISVFDLYIGGFDVGVKGTGLDGSKFVNVDVSYSRKGAMDLGGDDMLVRYSDLEDIGSFPESGVVFGVTIRGSDNTVDNLTVSTLNAHKEAFAVGFTEYGSSGNVLADADLSGAGSTGWTFGVWNNSDAHGLTILTTQMEGWDFAIGSVYTTDVQDSDLDAAVIDYGNPSTFISGNTLNELPKPTGNQVLYGNQFENFLRGGDGDDLLFGASGYDDLYGDLGADTFLFIDPNPSDGAYDRIIGFVPGTDKIEINDVIGMAPTGLQFGASATGSAAVMLWNGATDMLYYDADGAGISSARPVAFVSFAGDLALSDFLFT